MTCVGDIFHPENLIESHPTQIKRILLQIGDKGQFAFVFAAYSCV